VADSGLVNPSNALFVKGGDWGDSTNPSPGVGIGVWIYPPPLQGFVRDNGVGQARWIGTGAQQPVADGTYHHVALVVNRGSSGGTIAVYADGDLDNSSMLPADFGSVDSQDNGTLCARGDLQEPLDGSIDEFMIFGRALTSDEVLALARRFH
jgi:hypothetical protein